MTSKLPWRFKNGNRVYSADHKYIMGVDMDGETETCPNDNDSQFIVTAVNTHQLLVDALEKIAGLQPEDFNTEYEHWENGNYDDSFEYGCEFGEFSAANMARAALKAARGE